MVSVASVAAVLPATRCVAATPRVAVAHVAGRMLAGRPVLEIILPRAASVSTVLLSLHEPGQEEAAF